MHLIEALAAGIVGAPGGTAELFIHGTGSRSPYYTDFDGTQLVSGQISLDANGGASVYVDRLVDVVVSNATGATVRQFTAGANAAAVELRSQSFTGQDPATAISGAGLPTTVARAMDLWKNSANSLDFKVNVGGVSTRLEDIARATALFTVNVKDAAYGAVGDGVTDDTAAIQAALNAAGNTRSTLFPTGVYRVTGNIVLPQRASLIAYGYAVIKVDISTATSAFTVPNQGSLPELPPIRFQGLSFLLAQSLNATMFIQTGASSGAQHVWFVDCIFYAQYSILSWYQDLGGIKTNQYKFSRCAFLGQAANNTLWVNGVLWINECLFKNTGAGNGVIGDGGGVVSNSQFDWSSSAGTVLNLSAPDTASGPPAAAPGAVVGCSFISGNGSVQLGNVAEYGNKFVGNITITYPFAQSYATALQSTVATKERTRIQGGNGTSVTINPGDAGLQQLSLTGNFTATVVWSLGIRQSLYLYNSSGVNRTFTVTGSGGTAQGGGASLTVNTGTYTVVDIEHIYTPVSGKLLLCLVRSSGLPV